MKRNLPGIAFSCAIVLAGASLARADGWELPNLNPFKSKASSEVEEPEMAPAKPSAWRRFSTGTKTVLTRTGEVLNPFDGKPAKKAAPKPLSGSTRGSYSGVRMETVEEEKPSFFSSMTSWMKPKEEPKKTRTVTDFLDMPRPY